MSDLQPADPDPLFDPSVPHPARVYGYWLGGKDHYQADRDAAEEVIARRPQVVVARGRPGVPGPGRRYLADWACKPIDIGPRLHTPTRRPGHRGELKVVYVDNDRLVLAHARALLTSSPQGSRDYIEADLRNTPAVIAGARWTLDFTPPVAVLLFAVLHFVRDADDPAGIVAALAGPLAPGSYLAISHLTGDFAPGPVTAGVKAYNTLVPTALIPRSHTQVSALFGGLPLVPPGVVPLTEWRPPIAGPCPASADMYAGLARLPGRA
jgi:hypothetical protein